MKLSKHRLIEFKENKGNKGSLIAIEANKNIPFNIARIFYTFGNSKKAIRGQHANKNSQFVLVNVCGQSKVVLDYGYYKETVILDKPNIGLFIPRFVWKNIVDFSEDCVLLILSDSPYDPDEYINDYNEYKSFLSNIDFEKGDINGN